MNGNQGPRKEAIAFLDKAETHFSERAGGLDSAATSIFSKVSPINGRVTWNYGMWVRGVEIALHGTFRLEQMLCWNSATFQDSDFAKTVLAEAYKGIVQQTKRVGPARDLLEKTELTADDKGVLNTIDDELKSLEGKMVGSAKSLQPM
jgi:hypothetical protein